MSLLTGNIVILSKIEDALADAEKHFDNTRDSNVFIIRNSLVYCKKLLQDSIAFEQAQKGEGE